METTYLNSTETEVYSADAFTYVNMNEQNINIAANIIGVSAGAIAGAMAEENNNYDMGDFLRDQYAVMAIMRGASDEDKNEFLAAIGQGYEEAQEWLDSHDQDEYSSAILHDLWRDDFEAVNADEKPDALDKLLHPSLMDVGPGNFKIATAIRLVNEYATKYQALGLEKYLDNYGQLVADLMNEREPLTAQLYGIYLKEKAENWFKSNSAYGDQWDDLPQEFRDALLITYSNVGETAMAEKMSTVYLQRHLPYEPQPGLTAAGGMNHLRNAQAIGASIGLSDYGADVVGVDRMLDDALEKSDLGIASRYALYRLRYVAVTGLDYSEYNTQGQLDLFDSITQEGEITRAYLADRAAFADALVSSYLHGNAELEGDNALEFKDETSGYYLAIRNDRDHATQRIFFGGDQDDTLAGGPDQDRLYGGFGNDQLSGYAENDYLEGNAGIDYLGGGAGNDELHGGEGDDSNIHGAGLYGGAGDDALYGEAGHDFLDGGDDRDLLVGGRGEDHLLGDDGIDWLVGGYSLYDPTSNRTYYYDDGEADRLEGGLGEDLYRAGAGDTINDKDGKGLIYFEVTLADGSRVDVDLASSFWLYPRENQDGHYTIDIEPLGITMNYVLDSSSQTLRVYQDDRSSQFLTIEHFSDGDFSIGLDTAISQDNYWLVWINGQGLPSQPVEECYLSYDPWWYVAEHGDPNDPAVNDNILATQEDDEIDSGAGDDTVHAAAGNDQVHGGSGNDGLYGDAGDDTLYGDDGDDQLFGGAGIDHLLGGRGDDTLRGGLGDGDVLEGGYGNDTYLFAQGDGDTVINNQDNTADRHDVLRFLGDIAPDDVTATRRDDDLILTLSSSGETITVAEYFVGDGVGYSLDAIAFSDDTQWDVDAVKLQVQQSTDGDDVLYGYVGDDTLSGGDGNDTLYGAAGNDTLRGGNGQDEIHGHQGNDQIYGNTGNDVLYGDAGNDNLFGGYGIDQLFGGSGNDRLRGYVGDGDVLNGGAGNDTYLYALGDGDTTIQNHDTGTDRHDVLRFLGGIDASSVQVGRENYDLLLMLSDGAVITVPGYFMGDGQAGYALDAIAFSDGASWSIDQVLAQALQGTDEADTLIGYSGADTIDGLAGNDTLMGEGGDDRLSGGEGNDRLYGGEGNDHLIGGAGQDALSGGEGDDILECGRGSCSGGAGNDTYRHVAGSGNLTIHNDDPDGTGSDRLILEGMTPDALIRVIRGRRDELELRYRIDGRTESVIVANYFTQDGTTGQAVDAITFSDVDVTWDIDYVMGLMQQGTEHSDSLYATAEGSTLHGLGGSDNLYGAEGDDALYGDAGNDYLTGEGGDDVLRGGQGDDRLVGGAGSDRYEFGLGDGHDRIYADRDASGLGDQNRLVFDEGIARDDLWFIRQADNSLLIEVAGGADSVQLDGYFMSGGQQSVMQLELSDGTVITRDEIETALSTPTERDDSYRGTPESDRVHLLQGDDMAYGGAGDDVLYGDGGNDNLYGESGNDQLLGGEGADILFGGAGNDQLSGGAGDGDILNGGAGSDLYRYALGDGDTVINNQDSSSGRNDVLRFSGDIAPDQVRIACIENDLILHLPDDARIVVEDYFRSEHYQLNAIEFPNGAVWTAEAIRALPVRGTEGDDQLYAFPVGGVVEGLGGDDRLFGGAGDDRFVAGDGNDRVESAGGDDQLYGGEGNDVLSGGDGNDTLMGEAGNDTLWGGAGDDYLVGGSGSNTLEGHGGSDTYFIEATAGENLIRNGGSHNSAEHYDRVLFAEGISREDVTFSRSNLDLVISVGESITTVESFFLIDGDNRENNVDGFEFQGGPILTDEDVRLALITGNDRNQVITGYDNYDDPLFGAGGDDTLYGLSGNDRLDGGVGNDRLEGGSGNDVYQFHQGDGQDLIVDTQGQNVVEFLDLSSTQVEARQSGEDLVLTALMGDGQVTVVGQFPNANASAATAPLQEIRFSDGVVWYPEDISRQIANGTPGDGHLEGTEGDDVIDARAGDDDVYANAGDDLVVCGAGNDGAMGGAGNDVLMGGSGNDLLFGQEGNDYLEGGAGDDILLGHPIPSSEDPLETARDALIREGYDWTQVSGVMDLHVSLSSSTTEYDVLQGGDGADWLVGHGELYGGSGDDRLVGVGLLSGGEGSDVITASSPRYWTYEPSPSNAYVDYYHAVMDRTVIQGGTGDDELHGDRWTTYVFQEGDGQDTIYRDDEGVGDEQIVEFRGDLTASDVSFERQGSDLIVHYGSANDQVRISDWFTPGDEISEGSITYPRKIDRFEFSDGSVITLAEAESGLRNASDGDEVIPESPQTDEDRVLIGDDGYDVLTGGSGNDTLEGRGGINHLSGRDGNDTLRGGSGVSTLKGGEGDDTYLYGVGDGDCFIINDDLRGGVDVLRFLEGISPDELSVSRDRTNLVLTVNSSVITVVSYFQNGGDNSDALNAIEFFDGTSWGYEDVMSRLTLGTQDANTLYGDAIDDQFDGLAGDDMLFGAGGGDQLRGDEGRDRLYGETGHDTLEGGADDDWLYGGEGDDLLDGQSGNDTLMGGAGNDRLDGGVGDDRYHYRLGDGRDVIDNTGGGVDRLCFTDLGSDRLSFHQDGNDLVVWVDNDPEQSVRIINQFLKADAGVDAIELRDGEVMTSEQIAGLQSVGAAAQADGLALPDGSEGYEQVFSGTSERDSLTGQEGNDLLEGWGGNDSLTGGAGNDRLVGGFGDDVYTFYAGDGQDVIDNSGGGYDTLVFRNIRFGEVLDGLMRSGDDLVVQLASTNDQVTLLNFFLGGDYAVDRLVYDRRQNITAEQIFVRFGVVNPDPQGSLAIPDLPDEQGYATRTLGDFEADHYLGSSGSDFIHAGGGDDRLQGNGGDDYLIGGRGSDLYLMGDQAGQDRINNYDAGDEGVDTLRFATTDYESLWFSRDENDLRITNTGSGDSVTLEHWYDSTDYEVDRIEVDGAVLLNQQVDQLVAAMAAYDVPSGAGEVIPQAVREELQPVLAESWQAMA